ncbi:MAG: AAA family ATPase [Colwellia sp.]|nr:AAA family ATPase [Colwellia sp.]
MSNDKPKPTSAQLKEFIQNRLDKVTLDSLTQPSQSAPIIFTEQLQIIDLSSIKQEQDETEKEKEINDNIPFVLPKMQTMRNHLDSHVIGQDTAKTTIVRAVHMHLTRCFVASDNLVKLHKKNVLLRGPSGCGKTEIARALSELLDIPLLIVDCASITPAGFKGKNIVDIATDIFLNSNENTDIAETSIVFLDEFDKIGAKANKEEVAVFKSSVLNDLLKFIEGDKISFKLDPQSSTIILNTENILVIAAGAFTGMEDFFAEKGEIGFNAEQIGDSTPTYNEITDEIGIEHYIKYGINEQVLGRLPIRTHCYELTEYELVQIQRDTVNSVAKQEIEQFFRLEQSPELIIGEDVMRYIAKLAISQKTGARELDTKYETLFSEVYNKAEDDRSITAIRVSIKEGKPFFEIQS